MKITTATYLLTIAAFALSCRIKSVNKTPSYGGTFNCNEQQIQPPIKCSDTCLVFTNSDRSETSNVGEKACLLSTKNLKIIKPEAIFKVAFKDTSLSKYDPSKLIGLWMIIGGGVLAYLNLPSLQTNQSIALFVLGILLVLTGIYLKARYKARHLPPKEIVEAKKAKAAERNKQKQAKYGKHYRGRFITILILGFVALFIAILVIFNGFRHR